MDAVVEPILDAIASIGVHWLYVVVGLLAFGETGTFTGLVVPGETGMIVAGAAAGRADALLSVMVAAGFLGAVAGDSVSYLLGRKWGLDLVRASDWIGQRLEPKVDRASEYFERRGGAAVFLGRWVGAMRAVVPFVAGMSGMPYPRFLLWNVLASAIWVPAAILLGRYLGRQVTGKADLASTIVTAVVAAAFLGYGIWWWLRRRRREQTV